jgi:hypothetical protein
MVAVPREVVPLAAASLLRELSRALAEGAGGRGAADDREALRTALAAYTGARHVFLLPDGRTGLYALLAPLGRAHPRRRGGAARLQLLRRPRDGAPRRSHARLRRRHRAPRRAHPRGRRARPSPRAPARFSWGTTSAAPTICAPWSAFARAHDLALYEDCAHAFGASVDGLHVGRWGLGGSFSLSLTKGLTGVMGGVVITDDDETAASVAALAPTLGEVPRAELVRSLLSALGGTVLFGDRAYPALVRPPHARLVGRGVDLLDRAMTERPAPTSPRAWPTFARLPAPCARLAREHLTHVDRDVTLQRALTQRILAAGPWPRAGLARWEDDRHATGLNLVARVADSWGFRRHLLAHGYDARSDYLTSSTGDASRFPVSTRLPGQGVFLPIRALRDARAADGLIDALRAWERPAPR